MAFPMRMMTFARSSILFWKRHLCTKAYTSRFEFTAKRGNNILLIGPQGAGKSSVAECVASILNKDYIEINGRFDEGHYKLSNSVVVINGSHILKADKLQQLGVILYLDVADEQIRARLQQGPNSSFATVLKNEQLFYEQHCDVRVICGRHDSISNVAQHVIKAVKPSSSGKYFSSTRSSSAFNSFTDVVIHSLAPDRGLYVKKSVPKLTMGQWERMVGMSYSECALRILEPWIPATEIGRQDLRSVVSNTYTTEVFTHPDIAPVIRIEKNQFALELFYGPTGTNKDFSLQLSSKLFGLASKKYHHGLRTLLLVASEHDGGCSALNAFTESTGDCEVVFLHPEFKNKARQILLTSLRGPRTCAIGVRSDIDFCQSTVIDLLRDVQYDEKLRIRHGYVMSAMNSLNFVTLLPQIVYYAWSYLVMVRDGHIKLGDPIDMCIPATNLGNVISGYYAKGMGLPIRKMVVASQRNEELHKLVSTGVYDVSKRKLHSSYQPTDVLRPINLERYLFHASGGDFRLVSNLFRSLDNNGKLEIPKESQVFKTMQEDLVTGMHSDKESKQVINSFYQKTGYVMDPSTAAAKSLADNLDLGTDIPLVIPATSHYSRNPDGVLSALGRYTGIYSSSDLINRAMALREKPQISRSLWKDVKLPMDKGMVCAPKTELIKNCIEDFLDKTYHSRKLK